MASSTQDYVWHSRDLLYLMQTSFIRYSVKNTLRIEFVCQPVLVS